MINTLITTCYAGHYSLFEYNASAIRECIDAKTYILCVPREHINQFKRFKDHGFEVLTDEEVISSNKYLEKCNLLKQLSGWHKQQFIKLILSTSVNNSEKFLIWDSDTVPLKKLTFAEDKCIYFYKSYFEKENKYMHLNATLLGNSNVRDFSYISQNMCGRGRWMHELKEHIEQKFACDWLEKIHRTITTTIDLSEYELMGDFFSMKFSNEFIPNEKKWLRDGSRLFGNNYQNFQDSIACKILAKKYDYVAFENWQNEVSTYRKILSVIKKMLR